MGDARYVDLAPNHTDWCRKCPATSEAEVLKREIPCSSPRCHTQQHCDPQDPGLDPGLCNK